MERNEFAQIISSLQIIKRTNVNGSPTLSIVSPKECACYAAANSPDSVYKEKGKRWMTPFNVLVNAVARHYGYKGSLDEFYATSASDVASHLVSAAINPATNDVVYIRTKRGYNDHGSRKKGTKTTRKENTHMKNRKVTLTLFTLLSGAPLTLQITGAGKDATAWTRFLDIDLGKIEYEKSNWTKDVASQNQDAVNAVDAMIQIEEDYAAGKLDKDAAVTQFKDKYVEWVVAHLDANPFFVERRVLGLNCDDPMIDYQTEEEAAEDSTSEEAAE